MKDLLENKLFKVCLLAVIVIVLIIVLVALFVGGGSKRLNANMLLNAAKKYYEVNKLQLPKDNYDTSRVALSTLVNTGYLSSELEGLDCPSYVTVTNMNGNFEYNTTILCDGQNKYTTPLINKLTSSIVTEGSGLYNYKGSYIYRGENPNNYVRLGDLNFRIIGITENNTVKIIYSDIYNQYLPWDDRYNKDIDQQRGINDYVGNEKSRIKDFLDNYFTNQLNGEKFTSSIIALTTPHSVCIGKLDIDGNSNLCSKKLDNERISTITVDDYVNASLDPSCSVKNSKNCQNYNFLNLANTWTITADKTNSYKAYYINNNEGLLSYYANINNAIRPVFALRNSVVYVSGSGTQSDPYIVK